jgi:hypothetical protein
VDYRRRRVTTTTVQLCGRFVVDLDGRRVEQSLPGRQGRLLFAFLVLNRDRPVPRSELIEAVWSSALPRDPPEALAALLSKVRAALGVDYVAGRSELTIALPADAVVDVERAFKAVHEAESACAQTNWTRAWTAALESQLIARRRRGSHPVGEEGNIVGDRSAIEWTEATWNPVTGCSKVRPGCAHCYAETLSHRFGRTLKPWTPANATENVVVHADRLEQPRKWRRSRMIFVNSMSDLFHELVPLEFAQRVFDVMASTERHTFQVLTKRPERALEIAGALPWPQNVWLGVSIENSRFTWRADVLRMIPAAIRFISAEPLLGDPRHTDA